MAENCGKSKGIWIIFYRKAFRKGLIYSDARDEALCFGWIDSTVRNIDDRRIKQHFSPRRLRGVWSKLNKNRIENLIEQKLMTSFGFETIEKAKVNGSYYILDQVEDLVIPRELEEAFMINKEAAIVYNNLARNRKKRILYELAILKSCTAKKRKAESLARSLLEL
ncbi:MAG: hypothetical protein LBB13_02500 [Rickettsiales bacterium]|nr:hypothetical protein [Rickettsiales bacterium]